MNKGITYFGLEIHPEAVAASQFSQPLSLGRRRNSRSAPTQIRAMLARVAGGVILSNT